MIGAVPATWTCAPTRTAREDPTVAAMGDSAGTRRRSTVLVSRDVEVLREVEEWPPETVAVGVLRDGSVVGSHGPSDKVFRWASVTKLVTALAVLVAAEEGVVDLDEPAGAPGSTVRHLLAHASGLSFDPGPPIAKPGQRRIYSNAGFEALAGHVEGAAEMPFAEYLRAAVLEPLGLSAELRGSPAH